jgi:NitT/TauT family transport system substrate-binding protein
VKIALASFGVGLFLLLAAGCGGEEAQAPAGAGGAQAGDAPVVLRVGHFANLTHAHGLIAHALTREGKGWFEERLGDGVRLEWFVYNAGPSAMEGILAGSLDVTYVGPNPALNAHVKSKGTEVRVLAGATNGGSGLIVPGDGRLAKPEDFRGKKIATPQLGNTQDVACRAWLVAQGFEVTQTGGDVIVIPTQNPDQLALFQQGDVDAVWTVEPWMSRLELEAGGKPYLEEPDAITTVLACSVAFLRDRHEMAARFVRAHEELTAWITAHPEEAQRLVSAELEAETGHPVKPEIMQRCWPRLRFTNEVSTDALQSFVTAAQAAGFLRDASDVSRLVERPE